MTDLTEKTLATERKYTGKIISVDLLDIELPDGRKAKREVIRHGNAVAIIARRPDGKFVFVKQYRKAAEEALVEAIAGGLEPGEDPIEGAKRETAEETGYEVTSIKFLTTIICTPGYCEERIHLYFAELSETAHGQDQDPDENVYPVVLSEEEVEDGIRNGTKDYSTSFQRLARSKFRSRFHLSAADRQYIAEKGLETIRRHAEDFIRTRLAPANPPNDGRQTPMRGHPVFKAQHACACCCRGCLAKWWKVPKGIEIPSERQAGIVDFLMAWIGRELG